LCMRMLRFGATTRLQSHGIMFVGNKICKGGTNSEDISVEDDELSSITIDNAAHTKNFKHDGGFCIMCI